MSDLPPPPRPCPSSVKCNGCRLCCSDAKLQQLWRDNLVGRRPCQRDKYKSASECKCNECNLHIHKEEGNDGRPVRVSDFFNHNGELNHNMYVEAPPLTQTLICDHFDRIGKWKQLTDSGLKLPDRYQRFAKYVRRDNTVKRTSNRPPGHKQEYKTCPLRLCDDRTGRCTCQCDICKGHVKECTCCKSCNNRKEECTCSVLEFLCFWSL
jgi:hypothetical protein